MNDGDLFFLLAAAFLLMSQHARSTAVLIAASLAPADAKVESVKAWHAESRRLMWACWLAVLFGNDWIFAALAHTVSGWFQ